jgi:hypothetical protein
MAEPEEVADAIVYLASEASRYITGSELVIDGGFTAGMGRALLTTDNDAPGPADGSGRGSPQRTGQQLSNQRLGQVPQPHRDPEDGVQHDARRTL